MGIARLTPTEVVEVSAMPYLWTEPAKETQGFPCHTDTAWKLTAA